MATAAQDLAFSTGAGGITMGDTNLMIASIAITLIMLFAGWLTYTGFRAWVAGKMDLYDFSWAVIRVFLVVIIFGYYISP